MTAIGTIKAQDSCGTCRFGHRVDLNVCECHGVPPSPVPLPGPPDALGRPQLAIQMFRARLPANEAACSLWKPQIEAVNGKIEDLPVLDAAAFPGPASGSSN